MSASPHKSPWLRLAVVAVWAVAFALVEAMVVVYLRKLFGLQFHLAFTPGDFHFPRAYLRYEQAREAATMVMLLAVGYLAGRTWWQRLAYWLFAFGVWDIFYYVWLYVYLRWPSSPGTRDLLFLIPREWWAPVWQPVLASLRLHRRRGADPGADAARLRRGRHRLRRSRHRLRTECLRHRHAGRAGRPDRLAAMTSAGTPVAELWPPEAIEAISDASLALLARAGVRVDSQAAADLLVDAGCARGPQGRVLMPAPVVLAALEACPRAFTLLARDPERDLLMDPDPGPIYVHNMGEAPDVADARTGEARRATLRDQVLAARVMHHGRYPDSINPLISPSDVPAELHPLYSYLALHAETDKHVGGPGLDFPWQVRYLHEMSEAVGAGRPRPGATPPRSRDRPPTLSTWASRRSARCTSGPA